MPNNTKFRIYAAAYLVLENDEHVLLLKRSHTGYQDGNYSLVAGHLDGAETARQSIIREASEEAGIKLHPEDLEVVHLMHRFSPTREYFDIFLRGKKWSGEIVNKEPNKCDELKWFPLDELPINMVPEVRLALENIARGEFYSEFGWENAMI